MNFDLGMRRGEVMEKGDDAKMGPGEDMTGDLDHCDVQKVPQSSKLRSAQELQRKRCGF